MEIILLSDYFIVWDTVKKYRRVEGYADLGIVPACFENEEIIKSWSGTSLEWMSIELFIFCIYNFTMVIFMVKSRCLPVGISHATAFDNLYMSKMANEICQSINLDIMQLRRTKHY